MKTSKMIKTGALVFIGILAVMTVQAARDDMKGMGWMGKDRKPKDMQGCVAKCVQTCDKSIADLSAAMTALEEALGAVELGDTDAAKLQIETAHALLKGIEEAQKKCMVKMPVCNARCPVSGEKIDMMNTPEKLTTMCKGRKVGFCNMECCSAWKKMTDEEKEAKLKAAMPGRPKKDMMRKKIDDVMPEKPEKELMDKKVDEMMQ